MGYLTDNTLPGKPFVECRDLYVYRLEVEPKFKETREVNAIVRDQVPDVEEWQFSGRRKCPPLPPIQVRRDTTRKVAEDSLFVRRFTEVIRYAFRTREQRDAVVVRLSNQGLVVRAIDPPAAVT